jgi:hypothetical protein
MYTDGLDVTFVYEMKDTFLRFPFDFGEAPFISVVLDALSVASCTLLRFFFRRNSSLISSCFQRLA